MGDVCFCVRLDRLSLPLPLWLPCLCVPFVFAETDTTFVQIDIMLKAADLPAPVLLERWNMSCQPEARAAPSKVSLPPLVCLLQFGCLLWCACLRSDVV